MTASRPDSDRTPRRQPNPSNQPHQGNQPNQGRSSSRESVSRDRTFNMAALESLLDSVSDTISEKLTVAPPSVGNAAAFVSKKVVIPAVDLSVLIPSPIPPVRVASTSSSVTPSSLSSVTPSSTASSVNIPASMAPKSSDRKNQPRVSVSSHTPPSNASELVQEASASVRASKAGAVRDQSVSKKGKVTRDTVQTKKDGTVTSDKLAFLDDAKVQERFKKRQKSLEDILNKDKDRKSTSI